MVNSTSDNSKTCIIQSQTKFHGPWGRGRGGRGGREWEGVGGGGRGAEYASVMSSQTQHCFSLLTLQWFWSPLICVVMTAFPHYSHCSVFVPPLLALQYICSPIIRTAVYFSPINRTVMTLFSISSVIVTVFPHYSHCSDSVPRYQCHAIREWNRWTHIMMIRRR